uniref:Chondroitin proteoglycan 4 domain-containing protein n=1 Tax=Strongyloides stercoralis TaxID=6248 RepID=A0A0K0ETF3_STRER
MKFFTFSILFIIGITFLNAEVPAGYTSVKQCRCSDIDTCSEELQKRTLKCKKEVQCTNILNRIGNAEKIIACLDKENDFALKMDTCVKNKIGSLGCSNEINPQNLTIPLIPVIPHNDGSGIDLSNDDTFVAAPAVSQMQGPPELGQFIMCLEECSMVEPLNIIPKSHRSKRSPVSCAFLMKCALAPPDEKVNIAFKECEKEYNFNEKNRAKESCECLKNAGITSLSCIN